MEAGADEVMKHNVVGQERDATKAKVDDASVRKHDESGAICSPMKRTDSCSLPETPQQKKRCKSKNSVGQRCEEEEGHTGFHWAEDTAW